MRHFLRSCSIALFCIGCALSTISAAQEIDQLLPRASEPCAGTLEKRHRSDPSSDFTTNSRPPTGEQPTTYLHCIFNNDPKNVLEVDWLIPRVKEPIPRRSAALSPRYSDGSPIGHPDGCLIFGNLRDKSLKAQFWARPEDKDTIAREDGKDCLMLKVASANPQQSKVGKLVDSVAPFRVFLRSGPDVKSGLIAFEGITGARVKDSKAYLSFVHYRLREEGGALPSNMTDFTLAPRWTGPTEVLQKAFSSSYPKPIQVLSQQGAANISFVVEGSDAWVLQELEYLVRDRNGRVVASFFSPVYVPR